MVDWGFVQYPIPLLSKPCRPARICPPNRRAVAAARSTTRKLQRSEVPSIIGRYIHLGEKILRSSHQGRAPPGWRSVFHVILKRRIIAVFAFHA